MIRIVLALCVFLNILGCATNSIQRDKTKIILDYYGLYNSSPEEQFIKLKSTNIIPRSLNSKFGIFVYSNTVDPIEIVFKMYAKKYNEIDEKLMLTTNASISNKIGYNQLIRYTEEKDFEYEYWLFRVLYKNEVFVQQIFRQE